MATCAVHSLLIICLGISGVTESLTPPGEQWDAGPIPNPSCREAGDGDAHLGLGLVIHHYEVNGEIGVKRRDKGWWNIISSLWAKGKWGVNDGDDKDDAEKKRIPQFGRREDPSCCC